MGGPVADPSAYQVMTHPMVLECFGAKSGGAFFGSVDITFPDMLSAARWCALWVEHNGERDALSIMPGLTPFEKIIIVVIVGVTG